MLIIIIGFDNYFRRGISVFFFIMKSNGLGLNYCFLFMQFSLGVDRILDIFKNICLDIGYLALDIRPDTGYKKGRISGTTLHQMASFNSRRRNRHSDKLAYKRTLRHGGITIIQKVVAINL